MTQNNRLGRRFQLVRTEDASGISGTGIVATGLAYPNGAVHMMWFNQENDTLEIDENGFSFKPAPSGVDATVSIHGHEGRTKIRWVDDE